MTKVADVIIDTLAQAGVKRCYGVPGDTLNHVTDAIRRHGMRFVHVRHEEAGAMAAGAEADQIRELIQDQGATPNIPPKSNRRWKPCFSKRLYRERNLIERFFSKLKHFRRVATR